MKEVVSTAIGFLVAALPIAAFFALGSPGLGGGTDADWVTLLGLTLLFYGFSISFTVLIAGPLFLALRYANLVRWWSAAIGGLVVSGIVIQIISPTGLMNRDTPVGLCIGALSGLLFWFIWRLGARRSVEEGVR
jgi:hypothetical protein